MALWPCNVQAQDWVRHNRSLALSASVSELRYREIDTQGLTRDGTLNTERGVLSGGSVQGRWQASHDSAVPLWVQGNIDWVQGRTAYQGYLQSGSQLTSYSARTGNRLVTASASFGVVLPLDERRFQFLPYVNIGHRRWQRNLVQYGETYTHTIYSLGLLMQWGIQPEWVLEVSHQQGWQNYAHLDVTSFGFSAPLGNRAQQQTGLALCYHVSDRWSLKMQISQTRFNNGQSAVVNSLQGPPSSTRHKSLVVATKWYF